MKPIIESDIKNDIKIPKEILNKVLNNLLFHYYEETEERVRELRDGEWSEQKIDDEACKLVCRTLGITTNTLDHIVHGTYKIV